MNVRYQSVLVSNHINWELKYEDCQFSKETCLNMAVCLIGVTVAWPISFLSGALMFPLHSFNYLKSRWNQYKIISVLSNTKRFQEYSEKRIQVCERQIEHLKSYAVLLMEKHLKVPTETGLSIPQNKQFKNYFSSELSKNSWKAFSWDRFRDTDFFQKSNISNVIDKNTLHQLEQIRTKINFLYKQKLVLSNSEERVDIVKKIAEMSFVKNAFRRQESKKWMVHSILWLLPSGMFWDFYFNLSTNDRLTYAGNKSFLPIRTDLQIYDDLIDAHNKLVKNNDFIVPYIEHKIV